MFCTNCSKLVILQSNRVCIRCQGVITNNVSCICDVCSKEQNMCSVCLKHLGLDARTKTKTVGGGCKACGAK